jgi:hypothetical protein
VRLKQESHEFKVSLSNIVRPCLKQTKKKKKKEKKKPKRAKEKKLITKIDWKNREPRY